MVWPVSVGGGYEQCVCRTSIPLSYSLSEVFTCILWPVLPTGTHHSLLHSSRLPRCCTWPDWSSGMWPVGLVWSSLRMKTCSSLNNLQFYTLNLLCCLKCLCYEGKLPHALQGGKCNLKSTAYKTAHSNLNWGIWATILKRMRLGTFQNPLIFVNLIAVAPSKLQMGLLLNGFPSSTATVPLTEGGEVGQGREGPSEIPLCVGLESFCLCELYIKRS